MADYSGRLNSNEIYGAFHNMIISIQNFGGNIKGTNSKLVDSERVDGGLYGDTKIYRSVDVLETKPWGADDEAQNLLALHRNKNIKEQSISVDIFRYIATTTDSFLSKRAWESETAFSEMNGILEQQIQETKKIYDAGLYNSYIGTTTTEANRAVVEVDLTEANEATGEEKNRLEAQLIAQSVADLIVDLEDFSRDFNDYKYMRSYDTSDFKFVWNSKYLNKITKVDLPTIFHKDIVDKLGDYSLPKKYFGDKLSALDGTYDGTVKNDQVGKIRTISEGYYSLTDETSVHLFPSEALPENAIYTADQVYVENDKIVCKIMKSGAVPYMTAFQVGTDFFNPLGLTKNHYFIFGHNTLQYLENLPLITVKVSE